MTHEEKQNAIKREDELKEWLMNNSAAPLHIWQPKADEYKILSFRIAKADGVKIGGAIGDYKN